jgi:hypothetical protein
MERRRKHLLLGIVLAVTSTAFAENKQGTPAPTSGAIAFDRVIDKVLVREAANTKALRKFSPLVETYLQYIRPHK